MTNRWIPRTCVVLAAALALSPVFGQTRGSCVVVETPSDVRLPDGTIADRGTLRLCVNRTFSPVTVMHTILANGIPLGLYSARAERSEGSGLPHPLVAFTSRGDGTLTLSGYAEGAGRTVTCRFASASAADAKPIWLAARLE
ncbi:MAG TPA: hypothetical protein VF139_11485 [Candidatus Polarisedimenticolaceae bacterium]